MGKLDAKEAMEPTCGGCRHFVEANESQGICYYNPPVPYPVPTQGQVAMPGNQGAPGIAVVQLRPPVGHEEIACAHWERISAHFEPISGDGEKGSPGDR